MPYGTWYKPGDYNVIDDISGFRLKHSQARKIPGGQTGGLLVDAKRWEPQHPQDFVRGIADDQSIAEARPRQPNRFVVVATFVTTYAPRLTHFVQVDTAEGFTVNDKVALMLDNGENYFPTITGIEGNIIRLTPALPHGVGGTIGSPIENTMLNIGPSDAPPFLVDDAGVLIGDDNADLLSVGS